MAPISANPGRLRASEVIHPSPVPAICSSTKAAPADDATPDPEALTVVENGLRTVAAPEQTKKLLTLAKGNSLVMLSLHNYAAIANRYHQDRPRLLSRVCRRSCDRQNGVRPTA